MNESYRIKDLSKTSKAELEVLIAREQKILGNKYFIARLPDKGDKICQFYKKLCCEYEKQCSTDLLVNAAVEPHDAPNLVEWDKNTSECIPDIGVEINPSLFKFENIELGLLVNNSATTNDSPKIKSEQSLIKEQKLYILENALPVKEELDLDIYSQNIITFDLNHLTENFLKFKPFYTTKTDVHNPTKEKCRKKCIEITSATPPTLQHDKIVQISLHDSIQLQMKQEQKIQEIQKQNAVERVQRLNEILKNQGFSSNLLKQPNEQYSKFFTKYREDNKSDSEDSYTNGIDSDLEEHDEDDEPKGCGVTTVFYSN